jgi:hypothetical protein
LINFPNDKQTHESLESGFPETTFRETNMALVRQSFHRDSNSIDNSVTIVFNI